MAAFTALTVISPEADCHVPKESLPPQSLRKISPNLRHHCKAPCKMDSRKTFLHKPAFKTCLYNQSRYQKKRTSHQKVCISASPLFRSGSFIHAEMISRIFFHYNIPCTDRFFKQIFSMMKSHFLRWISHILPDSPARKVPFEYWRPYLYQALYPFMLSSATPRSTGSVKAMP